MRKFILIAFCFSLVACGMTEKQTQNSVLTNQNAAPVESAKTADKLKPDSSKFLSFTIGKAEVKPGSASEAAISLKIHEPYHVNSNPPSEKSFIPLEISLENGAGLTIGKPIYPKGEPKTFTFSENKPLSVYSGEVTVKVPLKADKTAVAGQQTLNGKLTFQPCDEEVCYRPQTVDLKLPVTVN
ncbi:MAG: protein-disulfide reductase DsbD N-terminal domain-containing protein [Pyrinomonadaceae bacterium]